MKCVNSDIIDLKLLSDLCWSGIPDQLRKETWPILLKYKPANREA